MRFRNRAFTGDLVTRSLSGSQKWELPDDSGTLALAKNIPQAQTVGSWITPIFLNGYGHYSVVGHQPLRYRLNGSSVELQGSFWRNGFTSGETHLFTLPLGMRPQGKLVLPSFGTTNFSPAVHSISVDSNGIVAIRFFSTGAASTYSFLSCSFSL